MIRHSGDLVTGDVGFYVITGRTGAGVRIGQGLIDVVNLFRGRTVESAWFTHAYIVINVGNDADGRWTDILEAMPSGARVVRLRGHDRIGPNYGYARLNLTAEQRDHIMVNAPRYEGVGYSFADYLSIALLHLGLPRKWLARRVAFSGRMICSQLVDHILTKAGLHLFTDGRVSQDVTPGALFHMAGAKGQIVWW